MVIQGWVSTNPLIVWLICKKTVANLRYGVAGVFAMWRGLIYKMPGIAEGLHKSTYCTAVG